MKDRIPDHRYAETISRAFAYIPRRIARRLDAVRFVCGVNPEFIGLHDYVSLDFEYAEVAHCCYDFNLHLRPVSDRPTTIVLPSVPPVSTVVHELGHALHGIVGFDHVAAPVTEYGRTNRYEAFAEAFTEWTFGHGWYGDEAALMADGKTVALFESLACS